MNINLGNDGGDQPVDFMSEIIVLAQQGKAMGLGWNMFFHADEPPVLPYQARDLAQAYVFGAMFVFFCLNLFERQGIPLDLRGPLVMKMQTELEHLIDAATSPGCV